MTDERILDRIKKMLNLAKSANQHEAATAMAMAQKLMEKHSLSLEDLNLESIQEGYCRSRFSVSVVRQHETALINTVCKAFGVQAMWQKSHSLNANCYGFWILVGPSDQLQIAAWTFDTLGSRLVKARAQFIQGIKDRAGVTGRLHPEDAKIVTREADTYCLGWVKAIYQMVHEFAQPQATRDLITRYIEKVSSGKEARSKSSLEGSQESIDQGRADGSKERLYRPMEGSQQARLPGAKV